VAGRYKAWVCSRSLDVSGCSNTAGGMSVVSVVCCVGRGLVLRRSRAQRSRTECSVSECDREESTIIIIL